MIINLDFQLDWIWCQIRDTLLVGFIQVSPGRINQGRKKALPQTGGAFPQGGTNTKKFKGRKAVGILRLLLLSFMSDSGSFRLLTQTEDQHLSRDPASLQTRLGQQRCPTSWTNSPAKRTPGSPPRLCPASEAAAKTFLPLEQDRRTLPGLQELGPKGLSMNNNLLFPFRL